MIRRILLFMILFAFSWTLTAQEEDPELVLPEMVLEVTSVGVEDVQALLPEEEELPLPELDLPLPEVEALDVRVVELEGFTLEYRPGQEEFGSAGQSDLFLNARMGLGSPNALDAYFQVMKLGDSPRFRLEFEHSGQDGYWFQGAYNPPGRNQNQGSDRFLGEFIYQDEAWESISMLEIRRSQEGLQSLGPFQSLDLQGLYGSSYNAFTLAENWRWSLDVEGQVRNMVLSGDNSRFHQGADLAAYGGAVLSGSDLSFSLELGGELEYLYADENGSWENRLWPYMGARESLELALPWDLEVLQSAQITWAGGQPLWGADVFLERKSRDLWSFALGAEFFQELMGPFDRWATGENLSPENADSTDPLRFFEGRGSLRFYFGQSAELSIGGAYRWEDDYPEISSVDSSTGLFAWDRVTQERITPELGLILRPVDGLKWENRFRYHFLSLEERRAAEWDFTLDWLSSDGFWGFVLDQKWSLFPSFEENFPQNGDPNLPVVDAGVYFTWNESFLTRLEVEDGLGAFLGQGRRGSLTEVLQPGFSIKATAEISY